MSPAFPPASTVPALCRGDRGLLHGWIEESRGGSRRTCILLIALGCGCYGFTIGLRNGWEMGAYVAFKLPAILILTLVVNGLFNGMLGLALGSGIGFRQSLQFLLTGFAIMSVVLGALSPITFFTTLSMPAPGESGARQWHAWSLLLHTAVIAFAGILAHHRLLGYVRGYATSPAAGTRTFLAWLAGNLFVGAQVSWVLRPFFVAPGLPVEFLRPNPLHGNFYETVLRAARLLAP